MRVTPVTNTITPSRRSVASVALSVAAIGLAIVGIIMNGLFARTHGSTDIAGWLFLAFGVVADLTSLAMPSCAARLWAARQRAAAAMAWVVWATAFAYALTEGIGFVSPNTSMTSPIATTSSRNGKRKRRNHASRFPRCSVA
jgi:hypothetical protein